MSTAAARILRAPAAPAPGPASPATFYRDPAAGEAKRPALLVAGTAAARPRPQPAVRPLPGDGPILARLRLAVAILAYLAPLAGMWIALRPIL